MNRFACPLALLAMSLCCAGCGSDSTTSDSQNGAADGEVEVASVELDVPAADAEPEDDRPEPDVRASLLLRFMTDPLADAVDAQSASLPGPVGFLIPRLGRDDDGQGRRRGGERDGAEAEEDTEDAEEGEEGDTGADEGSEESADSESDADASSSDGK